MKVCPHCEVSFDESKQYIFCPNCHRTPNTVEDCVKAVRQYVDIQEIHQQASDEYWRIIVRGMRRIIMDRETSLEVGNILFQTPLGASPDLLDP